jgi:hypothetical protein
MEGQIMNRITIIISLLMLSSVLCNAMSEDCFVVIGDNTYYCNSIRMGQGNTRIYSESGMMKIPTPLISAYFLEGKLFERMPVVNKNMDTAGWAFMQFIASRSGYRLYRYCSNCVHYDPVTGEIAPPVPAYRYYVFKDRKFVAVADDRNVKNLLTRFGVKLIS